MPWSKKQMQVAEAVKHGWKPKGSAKGFTKEFADQVIEEGVKPGSIGHLAGVKKRKKVMT
jgi:hypothetical protein